MTTLTWELPGGEVSSIRSELLSQFSKLFGTDIWYDVQADQPDTVVTPAGDWLAVDGHEALRQSLLRRTITNPGELATIPGFGVGARLYIKARNTPAMRDELEQRIRSQYLADPRVEAVGTVSIEQLTAGPGLKLSVQVVPRGRLKPDRPLILITEVR